MIFGTKIIRSLKKKLYPPRCIFCRTVMEDSVKIRLCAKCAAENKRIPSEHCPICGLVTPLGSAVCWSCASKKLYFTSHKSPYFYEGDVRHAIIRLKFYGKASLAETMGIIMSAYIPFGVEIDCVTWVPMTKKAIRARGYNQAMLLAKSVAENTGLETAELLEKIKEAKRQSTLKASERAKNVRGVFECVGDVKGKTILLIDDVYTTGATVNECSKMLKKHGANEVYCVTFAATKGKK